MTIHFHHELDKLKSEILSLSSQVEERVHQAVESVESQNTELARCVIEGDAEIDRREVEIEEECLKNLALHQPVAVDLRLVVAILKINNDLERIGDLAVNIAKRSLSLASESRLGLRMDLSSMAKAAREMLRKSLDSLLNLDAAMARGVCSDDEIVDQMNSDMHRKVREGIREFPDRYDYLLHHLLIARSLERIADLSTNIAEDVIYMAEGVIVRHGVDAIPNQDPENENV